MSSTDENNNAQKAAAVYLEMRGYEVMERNWRRPRSLIDIIATKAGNIYFIEVNFINDHQLPSSLEALTSSKLLHMQRSAWAWVDENEYRGKYVISTIEISGHDYVVMSFNENII